MSKKFTFLKSFIAISVLSAAWFNINAQCTYTGLAASYCTNSPASTLVPTSSGGSFSGSPGLTGNVFSPSLAGPGTHTVNYGICTSTYNILQSTTGTLVTFAPISVATYTNHSTVSLTDDAITATIPIGFSFKFFCNTYTSCVISSNGFISFNTACGNGCCSGGLIPTSNTAVDNLIASCWTDLNPGVGGTISYITLGTAPTRTFIVSYLNVPFFSGGGSVTNQIQLHEGTDAIEVHTTSKPTSGSIVTMGIQNSGSSIGYAVTGRNASTTWTAANEAVRFEPVVNCAVTQTTIVYAATMPVTGATLLCSATPVTLTASSNLTYTWTGGTTSASSLVVVTPVSTTNYSVSATNVAGCISNAVITVTVGTPAISISTPNASVCLGQSVTLTASGATTYTWSGGVSNGVSFIPPASNNYIVNGSNSCGTTSASINVTVAPIPIAVAATPTSICAGSIATLAASAAASSYTWSPIATINPSVMVSPIVSSIFTVTATNGTCLGTATVALNVVPVPTLNASASSTNICAGESVTLSASGALNYSWTPGGTGQSIVDTPVIPSSYLVTGDNSFGCTGNSNVVVIVAPSPTLIVNTSAPFICSGESVTLSVSGANTYTWSSGGSGALEVVSPAASTVYSITGLGTTNLCATTETVGVDVFTPNVLVTGNSAVCSGATATLLASGASSYTWNTGSPTAFISVNPSATTVYTVSSLTSTNSILCAASNTFQVAVNPNPVITASSARAEICKNESVTLSASGGQTYLWSNGANTASTVVTSSLVTTLQYTVTGTNVQGCSTSTIIWVKVNGCNAITENSALMSPMVYPNPNAGEFVVSFQSNAEFNLVNELGQLVKVLKLSEANQHSVTISGLANGVYFLQPTAGTKALAQKIVISR